MEYYSFVLSLLATVLSLLATVAGEDAMTAGAERAFLEFGQAATESLLLNLDQNLASTNPSTESATARSRVLLLSYPNSGTSFTMHVTRCFTRADVCTSYVEETQEYKFMQYFSGDPAPCGPGAWYLQGKETPGSWHRLVKTHGVGFSADINDDKAQLEQLGGVQSADTLVEYVKGTFKGSEVGIISRAPGLLR